KRKQRFLKVRTTDAALSKRSATDVILESTSADTYSSSATPIPVALNPKANRSPEPTINILDLLPEKPEGKVSSKKRKRLEKFIQSQLKKEERVKLVKKLGAQHLDGTVSDLLRSSKALGHVYIKKLTAREKLRQSLKEEKFGIPISDPSSRLFVDKEQGGDEFTDSETGQEFEDRNDEAESDEDPIGDVNANQTESFVFEDSTNLKQENEEKLANTELDAASKGFGSALKKAPQPTSPKKKKKPKKRKVMNQEFSGLSSDEDAEFESNEEKPKSNFSVQKDSASNWKIDVKGGVKLSNVIPYKTPTATKTTTATVPVSTESTKSKYYVQIVRPESIALSRMSLPILKEEHAIMEKILKNTTTILCGETGSGKTSQLPQMLYEYGFGNPSHPEYSGIVGITQPRRVAAVSMARRVAEEMGMTLGDGQVGYQIRYDSSTVSAKTRMKFMTEGILLRELTAAANGEGGDLLLSKYSAIIIDEAHERTVGTDVLIGWLTRIAGLRNGGKIKGVKTLKLIIMSATLRVEDFTSNSALFPPQTGIPPVVKVDGRQYKVTIHYNKVTPEIDYISEAFKKVSKIHAKLPHGAILVFLTGQSEITTLVNRLRRAFPENQSIGTVTSSRQMSAVETVTGGGLFGEAEDGRAFDEAEVFIREDGVDDFDESEFLDENDEEDTLHFLDGRDDTDAPSRGEREINDADRRSLYLATMFLVVKNNAETPLHVLPLYSLMPTEAQMRVFDPPPAGSRLCIVATNVAETSLTIPGVKYVVDCGKVKERRYDTHSGVQTFEIGWTSRASADQRAGRAGRVGPGHCYRLFSSAVFANHFEQFSRPEMLRVPIEGVVLQMKAMGISNVVGFPFPTPPGRENLIAAETLLMHLGATEKPSGLAESGGKITELGKILAKFPVSPRYAKMLVIAADQTGFTLPYTIALVAGLSVGDPFLRDDSVDEGQDVMNEENAKSKKVGEWHRVMQMFAGDPPNSDPLKILRAIGAYSAANAISPESGSRFIATHFLRPKAIEEINRLRQQLVNLILACIPKCQPERLKAEIPPPTSEDIVRLRQILLAGFPDRVARYDSDATKAALATGAKRTNPMYSTMWGDKGDIFTIHSSSSLFIRRPPAEWLIYEEIIGAEERLTADNSGIMFARKDGSISSAESPKGTPGGRRLMLKNVTEISPSWLAKIGPKSLLKLGKILEHPEPVYKPIEDEVIGYVSPNYGPKMWELAKIETTVVDVKLAVQWFAVALLEGNVKPGRKIKPKQARSKRKASDQELDMFGMLLPYLTVKPSIITKSWSKVQPRVNSILSALTSKRVSNRESLLKTWFEQPTFLLSEYLAWLPSELHMAVQLIWPPVEFLQEFEVIPAVKSLGQMPPVVEREGLAKKLQPFLVHLPCGDALRRKVVASAAAADSASDSD
ncbi:ATP-dependent RNA helicase dhx37, partial [Entophlyctis luteolus]